VGRFVGEMTWGKFLIGYLVSLALGVAASIWLEARFGIPYVRSLCVIGAALFAWAAVGRPRYVYLLVRNIGWFSGIESDRAMRTTLWVLVAGLLVAAALLP
jgi:type IV secretory pathway TrbD component